MGRPVKYAPEFQHRAVGLALASGRSTTKVARSLDIKRGTLGNWVTAAREPQHRDADPDGLSESERVELHGFATRWWRRSDQNPAIDAGRRYADGSADITHEVLVRARVHCE
jgi:hypothetical protein